MTCIAYRAGVMAADTQCTGANGGISRVSKITRLPDGGLFAGAGDFVGVLALREWAIAGFKGKRPPKTSNCECLIAHADRLLYLSGDGSPFALLDEFAAIGTGGDYAIGAMEMGATAEESVKVAARHDSGTSEPIQVERV